MLGFTESLPKPKPEFPTSSGLPQAHYPDVTNQFNTAKNNMYQGITKAQSSQGTSGVNSMFQQNFQPGGAWDLTSKPDFPGTDNQGQTQYAQFQGGRVTGDFLNHHMLGLGIAASGQHPDFGLLGGEPKMGTPYSSQQLPQGMNHPQAIASGYKSYLGDNTWQNQAMNNVSQNTSDDGGIVLKGQVSKGGLPTPPDPTPQPQPEPDPDPTPNPNPNPFPWGFPEENQTAQRIPQVQSYSPQIPSPSPSQEYSDPMAGLLRHQMRFDAMNQTSFHPYQLPQPMLPSLSSFQQPALHSTPSIRVQYGGMMVHPQHAQEMAQVSHIYTQAGQQPLQTEEISNWPVNRQTHVGLANKLQHHMTMRAWQPSPQQIQARNFQVGSRGGFDNHSQELPSHSSNLLQLPHAIKQTFQNINVFETQKLGQLFGKNTFSNGLPAATQEKNLQRLAYIANWILKQRDSSQLSDINLNTVTPEQKRLLNIAAQLNQILLNNELKGNQRDDALTFAQGLKVLINANIYPNGSVDEPRFIHDLKYFTIDQSGNTLQGKIYQSMGSFNRSNAAYNLLGGPRLGAIGWNKKYWDHGQLYEKHTQGQVVLINQAHHFAAFFIEGLQAKSNLDIKIVGLKSQALDGTYLDTNQEDLNLSNLAISFGQKVREGDISWEELPELIDILLKK